ncbi:MAG: hypothetical protein ACYS22_06935 [Planctomycetota bacterium]
MSQVLTRKVLLAVAGAEDPDKGVLQSRILGRFTNARRAGPTRRAAKNALAKLQKDGSVEALTRSSGALGVRLTEAGRALLIQDRYDDKTLRRGSYSGTQLAEAVAPLHEELDRLREELRRAQTTPAENPGFGGAASEPPSDPAEDAQRLLQEGKALLEDPATQGGLIPIPSLRENLRFDRRRFDTALWGLAQEGLVTLHKRNDAADLDLATQRAAFRHPFTKRPIFYVRVSAGR